MKNLSAILTLAILLIVGLACSDSGETTSGGNSNGATTAPKTESAVVEYVTMTNASGDTVTSFKPSDLAQKFAVKFSASGAGKVKGVFTAVNAGGEKNVQILDKEMDLTAMMNTANFTLSMPQPFPTGDYKLDIYQGDKLVKTHNYKVR